MCIFKKKQSSFSFVIYLHRFSLEALKASVLGLFVSHCFLYKNEHMFTSHQSLLLYHLMSSSSQKQQFQHIGPEWALSGHCAMTIMGVCNFNIGRITAFSPEWQCSLWCCCTSYSTGYSTDPLPFIRPKLQYNLLQLRP